jgi:hypothetical protein
MRHERQDPRRAVRAAHERPPGAERRLPFTRREEGGSALSWRALRCHRDADQVTAQTPSSRRWLPRLIFRSGPVTRHQVVWGVGLQHVGGASAQRSHAPSVAAVRARVGRFAVPPLSIVASHLPTFAIRRLVRDALELSPLNDLSPSVSRSASHRSPLRVRQPRYSAASHCQRPHTRRHLLESEEVLRLLPFALCFAPRGAELRQFAYTWALQREFRCTSINGVCSESPARNGLRPPTQQ